MERTILVFKRDEEKVSKFWRWGRSTPVWSTHNQPRLNRIRFLNEKGIDTSDLMKLPIDLRMILADKRIKEVFNYDHEVARAIITATEPIKNKTQQGLFNLNSFDYEGEQTLKGGYNQSLKVNIELTPVELTPEMVYWEDESPVQFVDSEFKNQLVLNKSITPAGNSCYSLAVGCILENGILKVGQNAKFYFHGSANKPTPFEYYFQYNENRGENVTIPADMDIAKFNFFHYQWKENIKNGEYIKKDAVYVAKTDNGNYVIFQDSPRRAIVVLTSGEVVGNDHASYGQARTILTNQFDLLDYKEAIVFYNNVIQEEKEQEEKEFQVKMAELHEKNKGWYLVELHCFDNDWRRGGHRERWTNWKILADSKIQAYHNAVIAAEAKGMFWFEEAIKCQIDFYGVWTDEKEDMLRNEGLI